MQNFSELPLVSVIIPAYNAEAFIARTLESVLAQTYSHLEVLVVDDGSRDRTAEIVEAFAERDRRVILIRQENAGVAIARNHAIQRAQGALIAPVDADDIWYPQKLEKQVACLQAQGPEVGLVYSCSVLIDEDDRILGRYSRRQKFKPGGPILASLICSNFLDNASSPLIRRECFERIGGYDPTLKARNAQGCEDWDLYLRIAEHYHFAVAPEYLIGYRQSLGSMATNSVAMARSYEFVMEAIAAKHPEIPPVIYQWSRGMFYEYLAGKSFQCGDHWRTLMWLRHSLQQDWGILLRPGIYHMLLLCCIKLLMFPLSSLIWPDHGSWVRFRNCFRLPQRSLSIEEINASIGATAPRVWKPYDYLLIRRLQTTQDLARLWGLSHLGASPQPAIANLSSDLSISAS